MQHSPAKYKMVVQLFAVLIMIPMLRTGRIIQRMREAAFNEAELYPYIRQRLCNLRTGSGVHFYVSIDSNTITKSVLFNDLSRFIDIISISYIFSFFNLQFSKPI